MTDKILEKTLSKGSQDVSYREIFEYKGHKLRIRIKSDAFAFCPENGGIRLPFIALNGLGENAALNIVKARDEEPFFSIEDMQIRSGVTKSVIEILRRNGVLDNLSETDQLTISF